MCLRPSSTPNYIHGENKSTFFAFFHCYSFPLLIYNTPTHTHMHTHTNTHTHTHTHTLMCTTAWVLHPISLVLHSLLLQVVAQYWVVQWWAGVLTRRKRSSQTNWRQCLIGARRVIWPTWLPWLWRRPSMKLVKTWVYHTKIHVR